MTNSEAASVELATQAYLYGFPLVFDVEQVDRFTKEGIGSTPATPFNVFGHAPKLAGPEDTFVSINNDTLYSITQLDLSVGPLLLSVPDTADAYYVLQFIDAWTNNFAYVGKRATGTAAGQYLLTPPGWSGDVPAGVTRISVPTRIATIVGRWACDGVADLPRVHNLQSQLTLTPFDPSAPAAAGVPAVDPGVPEELAFWEKLRVWMAAFPAAARDLPLQQAFEPLGLLQAGDSPYRDADETLAVTLKAGAEAARAALEQAMRSGNPAVNGWQMPYHAFDYNADFFEVGTVNSPEWTIADRTQAILLRAGAALGGLWGNHGYEAAYASTYVDGDDNVLNGVNSYVWHLDPEPPVGAFWSITMYDLPEYFLVANQIDRYSIGDRTPGLVRNADGSITITISNAEPTDPVARANWLPAPAAEFRPLLRMYNPRPDVFDGTFQIPPITRQA